MALTAVSALASLGFSLAALRQRNVYAEYAASRSIALVVAVVVAFFLGSQPVVFVLAIVMTVVQGLDAVVGTRQRNVMKTVEPAVLAALTISGAVLVGVQRRRMRSAGIMRGAAVWLSAHRSVIVYQLLRLSVPQRGGTALQ